MVKIIDKSASHPILSYPMRHYNRISAILNLYLHFVTFVDFVLFINKPLLRFFRHPLPKWREERSRSIQHTGFCIKFLCCFLLPYCHSILLSCLTSELPDIQNSPSPVLRTPSPQRGEGKKKISLLL